jgi:hypothetical protein
MWKSSIPNNWFNLVDASHFCNIAVERLKYRSTLDFLEETQKYIYHIRTPRIPLLLNKKQKEMQSPLAETAPITRVQTQQAVRIGLKTVRSSISEANPRKTDLMPRIKSYEVFKRPTTSYNP